MQTEEVRLQVKIDGSGDLQPGVDAWSALTIAWNDKITKPGNWEDLTEFFGDYSETKYRFIISTLGVSQFTYGEAEGMTWEKCGTIVYGWSLRWKNIMPPFRRI